MTTRAVLLVEDNANDEKLTLRAFQKSNIPNPVVVVRDGVEALDYLFADPAQHGGAEPPALVLLDLKLPKLDGLEVLRRLRADPRTALLPVIILTSSIEDQDLSRGYALGANSYIRKPVNFASFAEAVTRLGFYWLTLNEPPPAGARAS
jgi:two-component system, response regulator